MTNKNIVVASISVTLIHFLLTSVVGYYIAVQIGTQMGQVVASELTEAVDDPAKAKEDPGKIYEAIKSKSDSIHKKWKFPVLLISLPAKQLMTPLLQEMGNKRIQRVVAKEITREEFQTETRITNNAATFLNSLSLGLMVFIMLKIIQHYKRQT